MSEPVCIVLNEREPIKLEAASRLERLLAESGINSRRLPIGEDIIDNVLHAQSSVLVLDYLLGDYSTGLDVLMRITSLSQAIRPAVFFYTDEPDVQVAVEALRMGAQDYIPLESSRSEERLLKHIKQKLSSTRMGETRDRLQLRPPALDDLVFSAATSNSLYKQACVLLKKKSPLILIYGAAGSGKRTLARALNCERNPQPEELTIDLAFYSGDPAKEQWIRPLSPPPALSNQLTVSLFNAECDDGDFLELVADRFPQLWKNDSSHCTSHLQVCTSDPRTLQAWKRLFPDAETLSIPSLADRKGDFPALVQRFTSEAARLSSLRMPPISPASLNLLASLSWPGEIRQLKSVLIDSLIASISDNTALDEEVELRRAVWEADRCNAAEQELDPLACAMTLEICGHRYRAAAARLGCSIGELYKTLHKE